MRHLLSVLFACFALTSVAAANGGAPAKARDVKAVVAALAGKGYGAIVERNGVIGYVGDTALHGTQISTVQRQRDGRLVEIDRLHNGGQRVSLWHSDGKVVQRTDGLYRTLMGGQEQSVAQGHPRTFDTQRQIILKTFASAAH